MISKINTMPLVTTATGIAAVAGAFATRILAREGISLWPFPCPLLKFTGIECPLCGLGRSLVHAFTLDIPGSLNFHPFGVPALILTVSLVMSSWLRPEWCRKSLHRIRDAVTRPAVVTALVGIAWVLKAARGLTS